MTQPATIFDLLERFRALLLRQDADAIRRLTVTYGVLYRRLEGRIDALLQEIEQAGGMTRGQLVRLDRYKALVAQTEAELTRYAGYLEGVVNEQSANALQLGASHSYQLLRASAPGVGVNFNRLNTEAIRTLVGFLDEDGPLFERIRQLAPHTTQVVTDTLIEAVGAGYNPRKAARMIRDAYGRGLTDAMRMTRTVQMYSYREASRANYAANADVLQGWIWVAALDPRTCPSCLAQHGNVYPVSERLNDHHNGRCAQVPLVKGFQAVIQPDAGREWFDSQPEAVQRQILGKGKYEAWTNGVFNFDQLSTVRTDDVYGPMRVETPLKALLPAEG